MPVIKRHSADETLDLLVLSPDQPDFWSTIAGLWELSDRLFPRHFPPGIVKHRSIEAHNRHREAWEAQAIQQATKGSP